MMFFFNYQNRKLTLANVKLSIPLLSSCSAPPGGVLCGLDWARARDSSVGAASVCARAHSAGYSQRWLRVPPPPPPRRVLLLLLLLLLLRLIGGLSNDFGLRM